MLGSDLLVVLLLISEWFTAAQASRSLAVEVLLSVASSRASLSSVLIRRTLGVTLSASSLVDKTIADSAKDKNAFALVARALRTGLDGSVNFRSVFASLEQELSAMAGSLTDEDFKRASKPAPEGYDAGCTDATLAVLCNLAADAVAALPDTRDAVAPLLIPALRADAEVKASAASPAAPKRGFGAAAAAVGAKLVDFGALLRTQARFAYPELKGWGGEIASNDVICGQEALSAFIDLLLRLPHAGRVHAVLPGAFMASSVLLGCPEFAPNFTISSPGAPLPAGLLEDEASLLVVAAFLPSTAQMASAASLLQAPRTCRALVVPIARLARAAEHDRVGATERLLADGWAILTAAATPVAS